MFILGLIIGGLIMTAIIPAISVSGRQSVEEDYNKLKFEYSQLQSEMIKCGMIMQSREDKGDDGELLYDTAYCPNCKRIFEVYYDNDKEFCPNCGQDWDWSEEE